MYFESQDLDPMWATLPSELVVNEILSHCDLYAAVMVCKEARDKHQKALWRDMTVKLIPQTLTEPSFGHAPYSIIMAVVAEGLYVIVHVNSTDDEEIYLGICDIYDALNGVHQHQDADIASWRADPDKEHILGVIGDIVPVDKDYPHRFYHAPWIAQRLVCRRHNIGTDLYMSSDAYDVFHEAYLASIPDNTAREMFQYWRAGRTKGAEPRVPFLYHDRAQPCGMVIADAQAHPR